MDMSSALLRRVLALAACAVIPAGYAHDSSDPHAHHHAAAAKTIRSIAEYVGVPDASVAMIPSCLNSPSPTGA